MWYKSISMTKEVKKGELASKLARTIKQFIDVGLLSYM
jgi:hypothetical protein